MPITEDLLDPGRWSWDYAPDTPPEVLDAIDIRNDAGLGGTAFATAFVTPGHIDPADIDPDDLLAMARWRGVIVGMGPQRLSHRGYGLLHLLGGQRRGGTMRLPAEATTPSRTLAQHFDDTMQFGTNMTNGLAKGSIVTTSAFTMRLQVGVTRREMTDAAVLGRSTAYEYRVYPNGTVDADTVANLYRQDQVILTPYGGHEGSIDTVRADITVGEIDVENWISDSFADWDGSALYGTSANSVPGTWRGIGSDPIEWWDLASFDPHGTKIQGKETVAKLTAAFITSQTQANNWATREAGRRNTYRLTINAELDLDDPWEIMAVGDRLFVYEPRQRVFDTTNQVAIRGGTAFPQAHRAVSWTTPVKARYGKYIHHWDTTLGDYVIDDVTRWVLPEDSTTSVELGATRRFSRRKPKPGPVDRQLAKQQAALTVFANRYGAHGGHRR